MRDGQFSLLLPECLPSPNCAGLIKHAEHAAAICAQREARGPRTRWSWRLQERKPPRCCRGLRGVSETELRPGNMRAGPGRRRRPARGGRPSACFASEAGGADPGPAEAARAQRRSAEVLASRDAAVPREFVPEINAGARGGHALAQVCELIMRAESCERHRCRSPRASCLLVFGSIFAGRLVR